MTYLNLLKMSYSGLRLSSAAIELKMSPDWPPACHHLQNVYHAVQKDTAEASAAAHLVDTAFVADK